jgi:hypothetical protein
MFPHRAVSLSDLRSRCSDSSVPCAAIAASRTRGGAKAKPRIAHPISRGPRVPESHRFCDNDNDNDNDGIRRLTDFRLATQLFG